MKRKQRKSLPWRRVGYVILIIIKFGEVLLWFSPRIINALRSYIKHSKECVIRYPNTSKLVKKTRLRLVFSIHFLVFGYLMKHSSSCLIYYLPLIAGEQERDRRLILLSVVSGTFLKRTALIADLKQNVGTFLAFLCSSNWNEWYVNKRRSKGPGVEFKLRDMGHVFHVNMSKCSFPKHTSRPAFTRPSNKLFIPFKDPVLTIRHCVCFCFCFQEATNVS